MTEPSAAPDTDAYARLYEREYPRLVAYARTLTGNPWVAEDLVAEAHFRVWRRLRGGHQIDNVPAYLTTTVRHLSSTTAGQSAREIPHDPVAADSAGPARPEEQPADQDPAQRVAYVDLLARVMGQLPERWVKALWLAEAEDQPLEAVGRQIGAGSGATAVLLHRAREGMRQAFLREQPGTPGNPACTVHWERMPAHVRGTDSPRQAESIALHVEKCPDCRDRLAVLVQANTRLPALVGPALLVLLAGGGAPFIGPLIGVGAGATAGAAAGQPQAAGALRSVRHLLRGQVGQAGPVAATVAGVGVVAVAGAAVAAGIVLSGEGPAARPRAQAPAVASSQVPEPLPSDASPRPGADPRGDTGRPVPNDGSTVPGAPPSAPASEAPTSPAEPSGPSGTRTATAPGVGPTPPTGPATTPAPHTPPPTTASPRPTPTQPRPTPTAPTVPPTRPPSPTPTRPTPTPPSPTAPTPTPTPPSPTAPTPTPTAPSPTPTTPTPTPPTPTTPTDPTPTSPPTPRTTVLPPTPAPSTSPTSSELVCKELIPGWTVCWYR